MYLRGACAPAATSPPPRSGGEQDIPAPVKPLPPVVGGAAGRCSEKGLGVGFHMRGLLAWLYDTAQLLALHAAGGGKFDNFDL